MPIKYKAVARGNPSNPGAPKKYYPMIHSSGRVTTRELAEQAALMSTLSTTDVMAAIEAFLTIIPKELAKGNIVELDDFGNFWLRTEAEGVEYDAGVWPGQITSLLPRFNPGKEFKRVLSGVSFEKDSTPVTS